MALVSVILAGGTGSRLWPVSRKTHPKQFKSLISNESLIKQTMDRISDLKIDRNIIICNEDHKFFVLEEINDLKETDTIIVEPIGRNTAPAIALAALACSKDDILLVLSADHYIRDKSSFQKTLSSSIKHAESDKLVTFGIMPNEANTGYGYIELGSEIQDAYNIKSFKEKPSLDDAEKYVSSKNFLWNSGIFMFKAQKYLSELKEFHPNIIQSCSKSLKTDKNKKFSYVDKNKFEECENISIDYAVMEKTKDAIIVPMQSYWSDVGTWSSLYDVGIKDKNNNILSGDILSINSSNLFVKGENKLIATYGLDNLIIVDTKDALLVIDKKSSHQVKEIVKKLDDDNRSEHIIHREVHRPWGMYDSVDNGSGFQVKRLTVKPKQKLSTQMHHHRSEHWVVVSGMARVHYEDRFIDLKVNESTYHDKEVVHSLENITDEPLILIEVQIGDYLGEDDIVRFSDIYGRVNQDNHGDKS